LDKIASTLGRTDPWNVARDHVSAGLAHCDKSRVLRPTPDRQQINSGEELPNSTRRVMHFQLAAPPLATWRDCDGAVGHTERLHGRKLASPVHQAGRNIAQCEEASSATDYAFGGYRTPPSSSFDDVDLQDGGEELRKSPFESETALFIHVLDAIMGLLLHYH